MTISSRNILLSMVFLAAPACALAQTQPAKPAPAPRPVVVAPPAAQIRNQQFQQQVNQQRLQTNQQQNAVREQLRQSNLNTQRNNTTDPATLNQLNNADRSQQDLYRARQQDAVQRAQSDPNNNGTVVPARAGSAGR
jgi:hypothetical protein